MGSFFPRVFCGVSHIKLFCLVAGLLLLSLFSALLGNHDPEV
jgi:hypothetical protein